MGRGYNDINEHTGAELITPVATDAYRNGWDAIFGKGKQLEETQRNNTTEQSVGNDTTGLSINGSNN